MVDSPERSPGDDRSDDAAIEADGGASPGFDEATLYRVVRDAVTDAILDVIGTLLLIGIGFVFVTVGGQMIVRSSSLAGASVGVALALVGLYVAAATLEIVPPIRDWV